VLRERANSQARSHSQESVAVEKVRALKRSLVPGSVCDLCLLARGLSKRCEKRRQVIVTCLFGIEKRLRKPIPFVERKHQLDVTQLPADSLLSALRSRTSFQRLVLAVLRAVQALRAAKPLRRKESICMAKGFS
jgi:hypothetical protein